MHPMARRGSTRWTDGLPSPSDFRGLGSPLVRSTYSPQAPNLAPRRAQGRCPEWLVHFGSSYAVGAHRHEHASNQGAGGGKQCTLASASRHPRTDRTFEKHRRGVSFPQAVNVDHLKESEIAASFPNPSPDASGAPARRLLFRRRYSLLAVSDRPERRSRSLISCSRAGAVSRG